MGSQHDLQAPVCSCEDSRVGQNVAVDGQPSMPTAWELPPVIEDGPIRLRTDVPASSSKTCRLPCHWRMINLTKLGVFLVP